MWKNVVIIDRGDTIMAFKRLFDDKFIADKQRKSDYRKWSERAIVVGFNGDTQTYDIVITTERLAGASKRTLNKTIRNIKSTIPGNSLTFSPGDAVLVGYVEDKREHPIIIGGGGNVVQEAAVVTIGSITSENEVEGGSEELTGEEGFALSLPLAILCPSNAVAGLTCSINCAATTPNIKFVASNGARPYTWLISDAPEGCSFVTVVSGPGNSNFSVSPIANSFTGGPAFDRIWGTCLDGFDGTTCTGGLKRVRLFTRTHDCDDEPDILCQLSLSFADSVGCFDLLSLCDTINVCVNDSLPLLFCEDQPEDNFLLNCDRRTAAMKSGGCCPCTNLFQGAVVTLTDAEGTLISETIIPVRL